MYNYGGYNNITYLGGEVQNPAKNIPRAIVFSVLMVAVLYLSMSMVIIGTIPWREAAVSRAVVSEFIGKVHGPRAAAVMTCLLLPALVALVGWIYVAATPEQRQFLGTAVVLWLLGLAAYFLRARVVRSWPFAPAENRSTVPA